MDFKGLADKAKEAAAKAAEQARGALGAPTAEGETPKSFAALTSEKLNELKDIGAEKIQSLIASFQAALPAIRMAGYELTEFEVELGVPPKLIPHFKHAAKSAEDTERAREMVQGNKLGQIILTGLLKAGEVQRQISVNGFGFAHIEIELGLIPSVRLQYKNEMGEGAPAPALLAPSAEPLAITAPES